MSVGTDRTFAWIVITEFGDDPETVTQLVGMEPTESYVKGDPWHGAAKRLESAWVVKAQTAPSQPLAQVLDELLATLETRSTGIVEASRQFEAQIGIAAYFTRSTPEFYLDKELVRRIAQLGCSIDVDTYCFERNEQQA